MAATYETPGTGKLNPTDPFAPLRTVSYRYVCAGILFGYGRVRKGNGGTAAAMKQ